MGNMFRNNCRDNCRDHKSDMDWRVRRREHDPGCGCDRKNERRRMNEEDFRMRKEHGHMHRGDCW